MKELQALLDKAEDKQSFITEARRFLNQNSIFKAEPVDLIHWIPVGQISANNYNPNSVARNEMRLLHHSITHDGFTQPVVVVWDPDQAKYVVVDGFHRYSTVRACEDVNQKTRGHVPCVVLEMNITDRMAATVRHNRARGKHSFAGMGNMVFQMLEQGCSDEQICKELGMEADELVRLKHVTGFSKLFENVEYRKAWETEKQIRIRNEWHKNNRENAQTEQDQTLQPQPEGHP